MASSQQPARSRRPEPVLITEAAPSLAEQHAARKKRYVITMAVRGVSLVLAAIFYQTLWLAIIFAALGTGAGVIATLIRKWGRRAPAPAAVTPLNVEANADELARLRTASTAR